MIRNKGDIGDDKIQRFILQIWKTKAQNLKDLSEDCDSADDKQNQGQNQGFLTLILEEKIGNRALKIVHSMLSLIGTFCFMKVY